MAHCCHLCLCDWFEEIPRLLGTFRNSDTKIKYEHIKTLLFHKKCIFGICFVLYYLKLSAGYGYCIKTLKFTTITARENTIL